MKIKKLSKKMMATLLALLMISSVGISYASDTLPGVGTELKALVSDLKVRLDGRQVLNRIIVIDGTSYLPVREMSNLFGVDVYYNSFDRSINLYDNQPYTVEPTLDTGRYVGEVKFTFDNGAVYEGGYRNGKFHGEGKIIYADGSMYEGNFINGVIEGEGTYTAINGDEFEGYFKDNEYYGYGTYTYANGDEITGEFRGSEIIGNAYVEIEVTGEKKNIEGKDWDRPIQTVNIYEKTFVPYKYNGTADIIFENGIRYEGEVSDNYFNGEGTMYYQNGSVYEGNWVKNKKTGKGTFVYSNGSKYDGYFLNDKYNGDGTFYYSNGDMYDGAWENGKRHGYGKYIEANGNTFKGMWDNDAKHTLDQRDDEDYPGYGEYEVDKKNTEDGQRKEYKQKWKNGKLIKEVLDK